MCEFYRDQLFEETLIQPVLSEALVFVQSLNAIDLQTQDKYKNPFSETLFKNTEKLQMTLRRALFTLKMPDANVQIVLHFFQRMETDLPQVNLLQKQESQSYARALDAQRRYEKVRGFKFSGSNFDDMCFVDSLPQLTAALEILE